MVCSRNWGVRVGGVGLGGKNPLENVMVGSMKFVLGFLWEALVEVGSKRDRLVLEVVEEVEGFYPVGGGGMAVRVEDDVY